ncbi:MAG: hypothetical protein AAGA66_13095 [Bacteroidota bacterium]
MKAHLLLPILLLSSLNTLAQGVGIGTNEPDESAMLEIHSPTGNKGLLIPRTTDRNEVKDAANGLMIVDESDNNFYQYNAAVNSWQAVFPRGGIIMWSGDPDNTPNGWALCDGREVEGVKTPDLSGRFIASYAATGEYSTIADTGGEDKVRINTDHLPSHRHELSSPDASITANVTVGDNLHQHTIKFNRRTVGSNGGGKDVTGPLDETNKGREIKTESDIHGHAATATATISGETGNGSSKGLDNDLLENRPRYFVLAFIMKL